MNIPATVFFRRATLGGIFLASAISPMACEDAPTTPVAHEAHFVTAWGDDDLRPGQFLAARDVEVDGDGTVYVLDGFAPHIEVFGPDGTHLRRLALDPNWKFGDPLGSWTGIAAGSGRVFASDATGGRLIQLTREGDIVSEWDVAQRHRDAGTGAFVGASAQPMGLYLREDGTLLAAECAFPLESAHLTTWSPDGIVQSTWEQGVRVSDVAAGPDGLTLMVSGWGGDLRILDANGQVTDRQNFVEPRGVGFDGHGVVYVTDAARRFVVALRLRLQFARWEFSTVGHVGEPGDGDGRFARPGGVSVGPEGRVYVADIGRLHTGLEEGWPVQVFDAEGGFERGIGTFKGRGPGQFRQPVATAADPIRQRVYVLDAQQARIQVFDLEGGFLTEWVDAPARLDAPGSDIAVGPAGTVYIADPIRGEVRWRSRDGSLVGRSGRLPGALWPTAVSVGERVTLLDPPNARVVQLDGEGALIRQWPSAIDQESDVATAPDGSVHVLQSSLGLIRVYSSDGTEVRSWIPMDEAGDPLTQPSGLEIDSRGNVFVVDEGSHRIFAYGLEGSLRFAWGGEGQGPGRFLSPRGISAGPSGEIFVVDPATHRVQRFDVR